MHPRRYAPPPLRAGVLIGTVLLSFGCGGDVNAPAGSVFEKQYFSARLNHHALTLAPNTQFDTAQLVLTPLNSAGAPLDTVGVTTFKVLNASPSITVSPTGLVTALPGGAPSVTGTIVVASMRIGHLTMSDSVVVNMNTLSGPPPVLTTFSIEPFPGDSAKTGATGFGSVINLQFLDQNDAPIDNMAVSLWSSDPAIATIDGTGYVSGLVPGVVTLYAEATVYGVHKIDSLRYTVGQPIISSLKIFSRTPLGSSTPVAFATPGTLTVGIGALVFFENKSDLPMDIVFDTPTAAQAGSIANPLVATVYVDVLGYAPNSFSDSGNMTLAPQDSTLGVNGAGFTTRSFMTEGKYPYHSTLYGTSGVIAVVKE